jgi:hypothetical protein
MAEQQAGSSQLLTAGSDLAEQLLLLVPLLLAAASHLSAEMPLQRWWAAVRAFGHCLGFVPTISLTFYIYAA